MLVKIPQKSSSTADWVASAIDSSAKVNQRFQLIEHKKMVNQQKLTWFLLPDVYLRAEVTSKVLHGVVAQVTIEPGKAKKPEAETFEIADRKSMDPLLFWLQPRLLALPNLDL
jgi:hypothetical protein